MSEKQSTAIQKRPADRMKSVLEASSVQEQFRRALGEHGDSFLASILDLYVSDSTLSQCEPAAVVGECLKAAVLKLPISRGLGWAYIVPFRVKGQLTPVFIPGYRGMIQLFLRTGQYSRLNDGVVYEGQIVDRNQITGDVAITGQPTSDRVVGYFVYFRLVNGFEKILYATKQEIEDFAKTKSPSWKNKTSAWYTDFDAMAKKTLWRRMMKYGPMSVEMAQAVANDADFDTSPASQLADDIKSQPIQEVGFDDKTPAGPVHDEESPLPDDGPDF